MSNDSLNNFNNIYTTYYRKAFFYVKSYVHDDMAAEDIVTDALIKLWELMKLESVNPVGPLLFNILKKSSLDYLKHQRVKQTVHEAIAKTLNRELEIRTGSLESSNPNDVFSSEIQQIIEKTMNSLPETTRSIFILSRFDNKSQKEIAEMYKISVKGVDYHIMQSVKSLRITLKDYLP